MSSPGAETELLRQLAGNLDRDQLAHAYLVVGSPQAEGRALAEKIVCLLYCRETGRPCGRCPLCRRVMQRTHTDVLWLEPESRSRQIKIEEVRELLKRAQQTSYEGGWKAGVMLYADRVTEQAANAFLKTLEEPPPRTLFLLVTAEPQFMMPTVLSRCQRISLATAAADPAEQEWVPRLLEVLGQPSASDLVGAMAAGQSLGALLDEARRKFGEEEQKQAGEEEENKEIILARVQARVRKVQSDLLVFLMTWRRDVLVSRLGGGEELLFFKQHASLLRSQAGLLSLDRALRQLRHVDAMSGKLESNLPAPAVFEEDQLKILGNAPGFAG